MSIPTSYIPMILTQLTLYGWPIPSSACLPSPFIFMPCIFFTSVIFLSPLVTSTLQRTDAWEDSAQIQLMTRVGLSCTVLQNYIFQYLAVTLRPLVRTTQHSLASSYFATTFPTIGSVHFDQRIYRMTVKSL